MPVIVLGFFAVAGVLVLWLNLGLNYWLLVPVAVWSLLVLISESLEGDDDKRRRLDTIRRYKR